MANISIPSFRVHGAEILSRDASRALTDDLAALYVLGELLDNYGNQSRPLDEGYCYGLSHVVKLIARDMTNNVESELLPCESSTICAMLDAETQAGRA